MLDAVRTRIAHMRTSVGNLIEFLLPERRHDEAWRQHEVTMERIRRTEELTRLRRERRGFE